MKPSTALQKYRHVMREMLVNYKVTNLRVFGSALDNTDHEGSDLDLLVDPLPGATLFDLGGLQADLEETLGVPVDLLTPGDLPLSFRHLVLAQAQPIWIQIVVQITSAICLRPRNLHMAILKGWKIDFLTDKRTQQAVILNIVVMGEAATKLIRDYPELIAQYHQVPWKNIKGMRNRIAHGYFDINLDVVWDTVRDALPPLIETLSAIVGDLG